MLEPIDISPFHSPCAPSCSLTGLAVPPSEGVGKAAGHNTDDAISTPAVAQQYAARMLIESFARTGFAYISGHGVDASLLDAVMDVASRFFRRSAEAKGRAISRDAARRGYSAYSSENFSSLAGRREANDLVEKFRIGPTLRGREAALCDPQDPYCASKEGRVHFFPNAWDGTPGDMEEVLSRYYEEMERVSVSVLRALEVGLGLPPGYFADRMRRHTSIMGLNYFPEPADSTDKDNNTPPLRIAEHTDVSMLTIIAHGAGSRGLEVYVDGAWEEVLPLPGALVVNIGDCLQDWTHNILRSSVHRVSFYGYCDSREGDGSSGGAEVSGSERISCAYFATPEHDTIIRPSEVAAAALHIGLTPQQQDHARGLDNFHLYSDLRDGVTYSKWRQTRIKNAITSLRK